MNKVLTSSIAAMALATLRPSLSHASSPANPVATPPFTIDSHIGASTQGNARSIVSVAREDATGATVVLLAEVGANGGVLDDIVQIQLLPRGRSLVTTVNPSELAALCVGPALLVCIAAVALAIAGCATLGVACPPPPTEPPGGGGGAEGGGDTDTDGGTGGDSAG